MNTLKETKAFQTAIEVLENDAYDIQEKFSNEAIALTVADIEKKLHYNSSGTTSEIGEFSIKARSTRTASFVSVSHEDYGTGVSRSLASLVDSKRPASKDEIQNLIEMLNEAWYHCNN